MSLRHDASGLVVLAFHPSLVGRGQAEAPDDQPISYSTPTSEAIVLHEILATVLSLGIYPFWSYYNQMNEPNRHFARQRGSEDALAVAVQALR
jgi:hypothetical protein